jgi:quercetin dioxygenase-like cupin family protein
MSKIAEQFNFKHIKDFEIDNLVSLVKANEEDWFFEIPVDGVYSKYYAVFESSIYWKPESEPFVVSKESDNEELISILMPIIKELEELHGGVHGEVLITKLRAGSKIPSHMDNGQYLSKIRRHHIPLITSGNVSFLVGSESINMKAGECWEINNNRPHSVYNKSETDRIHLIIDIMPKSELEK